MLELDRPALEIEPVHVRSKSHSLAFGKKARSSNVYRGMTEYGTDRALDDNEETRWATDTGTQQAWLEIDLGRVTTFTRAMIDEAYAGRVQGFAFEYKDGGAWKVFYRGETIGPRCSVTFDPVVARHVRLSILNASNSPTITEFQLYAR